MIPVRVSKNCREQLGSGSQRDSKGVEKGRGDARYIKPIHALLGGRIVRSLLCYCVRPRVHCCVLCDATRDLHAIHLVYRAPAKGRDQLKVFVLLSCPSYRAVR